MAPGAISAVATSVGNSREWVRGATWETSDWHWGHSNYLLNASTLVKKNK